MGRTQALAYRPGADEPTVIGAETARVLAMCREFRTMDEHVARMPVVDKKGTSLRGWLDVLARSGLLLSEDECLRQHDACAPGAGADAAVDSVGIVTRDRPDRLKRCLRTLGDSIASTGRVVRIVVCDDSTDASTRARNRASVEQIGSLLGIAVRHVGVDDKRAAVATLAAASSVPPDVIAFGLAGEAGFGTTAGANRNALLLATAGELTLSADDDVIWRLGRPAHARPGLRCATGEDPTLIEFHADRASALAAVEDAASDPISAHETVLGRTLGQCLARDRSCDRALIEGPVEPGFMRQLLDGSGRVIATSLGIAGDCGVWSPQGLLAMRGELCARVLAAYEIAIRSREIVRSVPQTTLMRGGMLMAAAIGLDNRVLLPPFFPVGRNQDGVFAMVAAACRPDGYVAHLPWAVPHDPDLIRTWDPDAVWADAGLTRLSSVVIAAVVSWVPRPGLHSPAARMVALGQHFEDLAALPLAELTAVVQEQRSRWLDHTFRGLENNAREVAGTHPRYEQDLARHIERLQARVSAGWLEPADVTDAPVGRRLARVQSLLGRYGRLLSHWPALCEAAEDSGLWSGRPGLSGMSPRCAAGSG